MSLRGGASNVLLNIEKTAYRKTLHDFLKNFWHTAVEFFTFMLEGVNHSWQLSPKQIDSSCAFRNACRPTKTVYFPTLDTCCPVIGHTYSREAFCSKGAEANWFPYPVPKVFSEIVAPISVNRPHQAIHWRIRGSIHWALSVVNGGLSFWYNFV